MANVRGFVYTVGVDVALLRMRKKFMWGRRKAAEELGMGEASVSRWERVDGPLCLHTRMLNAFIDEYKKRMGSKPAIKVFDTEADAKRAYTSGGGKEKKKQKIKLRSDAAKLAVANWGTVNYG